MIHSLIVSFMIIWVIGAIILFCSFGIINVFLVSFDLLRAFYNWCLKIEDKRHYNDTGLSFINIFVASLIVSLLWIFICIGLIIYYPALGIREGIWYLVNRKKI